MEDPIITPIQNCTWKDPDDGTCGHPDNITPECHQHICPIVRRAEKQLDREAYIKRLEDALCGALCVLRNEAGLAEMRGYPRYGETVRRWADEYESESGIDFDAVLCRVNDPHSKNSIGT